VAAAEQSLGISLGARTHDDIELASVYCLGACSVGPAAQVNGRLMGRLTNHTMQQAITEVAASLPREVTS